MAHHRVQIRGDEGGKGELHHPGADGPSVCGRVINVDRKVVEVAGRFLDSRLDPLGQWEAAWRRLWVDRPAALAVFGASR